MLSRRVLTAFVVISVAVILGSVAYVYAASNTVPARKVGDGAAVISHYGAIVPTYVMDTSNPQLIASVSFNLNADATTVKIKLVSTSNSWYSCTVTHSSPWPVSCLTTGATVHSANQFRVIAAGR